MGYMSENMKKIMWEQNGNQFALLEGRDLILEDASSHMSLGEGKSNQSKKLKKCNGL